VAIGFRVSIYSPRDPETGKQQRPSKYVKAPDTRAGRKKAEGSSPGPVARRPKQPWPNSSSTTSTNQSHQRPSLERSETCSIVGSPYRRIASRPRHWLSTAAARLKILPHIGDMQLAAVRVSDLHRLYVTLFVSGGEDGRALAPNSVRRVHIAVSGQSRRGSPSVAERRHLHLCRRTTTLTTTFTLVSPNDDMSHPA